MIKAITCLIFGHNKEYAPRYASTKQRCRRCDKLITVEP